MAVVGEKGGKKMKKMRNHKTMTLIATLTLAAGGLLIAPQVAAQETGTAPQASTSQTNSTGLSINAQMRKDTVIIDCQLGISPELAKGGQATIQLVDSQGNVLATIPYELKAGWQSMTAWFDLTGYPSGDYSVKASYNGQTVQSAAIHHQVK